MRRQYLSLKAQHPDCILFFRLGDFYETFDDDAKTVAQVCDVVLTSKPIGKGVRVPLAGVPYHSVDTYVARMIEGGYKVAIAEQMSEPGKGLVEREIIRVVTAGTVVEPNLLDDKRNNYLMGVIFDAAGRSAGIAYCDITTGEFAATQIRGRDSGQVEQRVREEVSRLHPSELIYAADAPPEETGLVGLLESLGILPSEVEPWQVEIETATDMLKRHFQVASLDGFGLLSKQAAVRASAAVLAYLKVMQPAALDLLKRLSSYEIGEFMTLDESTRRNLELTTTIRSGAVKGSLLDVIDATLTPMGGRLLRRWLGQPLLEVSAINRRLDAVQLFYDDTAMRLELRDLLRGLGDLERWSNRVAQGVALPRDLVGIREVLRKVPDIKEIGSREMGGRGYNAPLPTLHSMLFDLPVCDETRRLLESAIADEPPATLSTPGIIRKATA